MRQSPSIFYLSLFLSLSESLKQMLDGNEKMTLLTCKRKRFTSKLFPVLKIEFVTATKMILL